MSVLSNGDILYSPAVRSTLKQRDAVNHCTLCFSTGYKYQCGLYENVGWSLGATRRKLHSISFVHEAASGYHFTSSY